MELRQPVTTGYGSDNATDLIIIQFILIFMWSLGFFAEDLNSRERSKGSDGVRYKRCAYFCSHSFREKQSQPVILKGSDYRGRQSNQHHEPQVSNNLKHDLPNSICRVFFPRGTTWLKININIHRNTHKKNIAWECFDFLFIPHFGSKVIVKI